MGVESNWIAAPWVRPERTSPMCASASDSGNHRAGIFWDWHRYLCIFCNVHKATIWFWDPVYLQLPTVTFRSNPIWVQTRLLLTSKLINCICEQKRTSLGITILFLNHFTFLWKTYPKCKRFGSLGWCLQTFPASLLHGGPKSSWCYSHALSETLPENKHHCMQPISQFLLRSSWFQCIMSKPEPTAF